MQQSDCKTGAEDRVYIVLYDADGTDRKLSIDQVGTDALGDHQLLWIDVAGEDEPLIHDLCNRLGLDDAAAQLLARTTGNPWLQGFGHCFVVQAVAVEHRGQLEFVGLMLNIAVGRNFVMTVHPHPVRFIQELRKRDYGETDLGALSAESFTASLLDWQLTTYFEAVSDFEAAVERLEVGILSGSHHHRFAELHALRKGASRLRRMLAPHRRLFAGLARPDFRPRQDGETNVHFHTLDTHYERAMDMVENARDLVVGSFELFSSQTAWRTNRTMQALTFFTVLLGFLAVVAGVFGMNFEIALFSESPHGFWIAVVAMVMLVIVAIAVARLRRWL